MLFLVTTVLDEMQLLTVLIITVPSNGINPKTIFDVTTVIILRRRSLQWFWEHLQIPLDIKSRTCFFISPMIQHLAFLRCWHHRHQQTNIIKTYTKQDSPTNPPITSSWQQESNCPSKYVNTKIRFKIIFKSVVLWTKAKGSLPTCWFLLLVSSLKQDRERKSLNKNYFLDLCIHLYLLFFTRHLLVCICVFYVKLL